MTRKSLDEWFAEADDILTDWHGGVDAMHAAVPEVGEPEPLSAADSYYDQTPFGGYRQRTLTGWWASFTFTPVLREPWADWPALIQVGPVQRIADEQGLDGWAAEALFGLQCRAAMHGMRQAIARLSEAFGTVGGSFVTMAEQLQRSGLIPTPQQEDLLQRALALRSTRNTGPGDPYRLTRRRNR